MPDYAKDFERPGWSSNSKSLFKYTPELIAEQEKQKLTIAMGKERKKMAKKKRRQAPAK